MLTSLFNLSSTNTAGVKQAHVEVQNDATPGNITIEFVIDGNPYSQSVLFSANQKTVVSVTHTETGPNEPVSARERTSGKIIYKLLDLNAAESF